MTRVNCAAVAAGVLGALAGVAFAGPDVIVGDIPEVSNYGLANGIRAYAIGTTSCNLGDQPLTWNANTNVHPVISQNMYRIIDGRFEQIGQAWLKHGFCALQGTVCSSCTPGGDCGALYPGCSDPYSSGLNGSQGGLGPKSEVNAATGSFPYPWINNGSGNATIMKRLQVHDTDIAVAGVSYFVASMYVQPQDAASHNNNNNESYRRVTFDGSRNLVLAGTTQRTKPGVFAWRDHGLGVDQPDPGVILTPVDVASDGRFWIGSKATDLGGGQWRYTYAVQNLNSDRSAQAFSVPIPPGAVVSNINFHDVDYHSGEPYSLTDWTNSQSGGQLTWTTQSYVVNVNANALRWDTVYTFWFDCNVPPAGGASTLTLFKPGSPNSAAGTAVVPSPDGQFHPFNDSCATATPIGVGATAFDTTNATTDGPAECSNAGYDQIGNDIWFDFTAVCDGGHTVQTCGSTFDTKIAVYGSSCPVSAGTALACNDDSCGLQSSADFTAVAGQHYRIRVGGYASGGNPPATGSGTLTISGPTCGPQAPANDDCANAQWVSAGVPVVGATFLATPDGSVSCGSSTGTNDVWYKYRPLTTANVTVSTCGGVTNYDTVLSIHSSACGAELNCNDDSCGLQSQITRSMTAGTTYWIRVSGYAGSTGDFTLTVTGGGGIAPPANDDCGNRAGIGLGSLAFSTVGATTDGPTHSGCNFFGNNQITNDIWYNYPSQCDGTLTVTTCNSANFDTKIAVYDGAGCANYDARLLVCSDDTDGCGTTTTVQLPVVGNHNYTIRLGGYNGATGSGTVTLSCEANPTCSPCVADFNNSGGTPDDADVSAFFAAWNSGDQCADANNSGGTPDDADVSTFFTLWNNGGC